MTTQQTHTPGPWTTNKKCPTMVEAVADGQGVNLIVDCNDPDGFRTRGEDMANARLIAAAPDLLAALEEIAAWEPSRGPDEPGGMSIMDAIDIARVAIAAVEGKD